MSEVVTRDPATGRELRRYPAHDDAAVERILAEVDAAAPPDARRPTRAAAPVVLERIPLGRHGQPDDVVNAALYLASDESGWVSCAHLVVDGGGSALG